MNEGPGFWRACGPFRDLDETGLALLAAAAQPRNWPAGTLLFQRGDPGDYLLALTAGRLRLSLLTPQGQELTLRHAGPGEIVGELAVFDDQPRSADATAERDISALVLSRAAFQDIARRHPPVMLVLLRYLAGLLRETNDRLESIALYKLEARVARFLITLLRQAHGARLPRRAKLAFDLGQGELALMLGASRPKVNAALKALTEAGAIARDGALLDCDTERLAEFADPEDA